MVQKQRKIGGLRGFMSKLDEAEQRLQRAVSGLEEVTRKVAPQAELSVATAQTDSQIAAELHSARARNAELEDTNAAIAQRLDGVIDRIKTILEN